MDAENLAWLDEQADRAEAADDPDAKLARYSAVLQRVGGGEDGEALGWLLWATEEATVLHRQAGRHREALALFERARTACLARPDRDDDPQEARVLWGHAWMLSTLGRDDDADLLAREILDRFGALPDDPAVDWARRFVAFPASKPLLDRGRDLAARVGRGREAEAAFREAMALGSPHAPVLLGLMLLQSPRRAAEGEALLRAALDASDDGWVTAHAAARLGRQADGAGQAGRPARAVPRRPRRDARAARARAGHPPDHHPHATPLGRVEAVGAVAGAVRRAQAAERIAHRRPDRC